MIFWVRFQGPNEFHFTTVGDGFCLKFASYRI